MSVLSRPHWNLGGPASAVDHPAGTCNIKCRDTKSSKYTIHESTSRCADERGKPSTNYKCLAVWKGGPGPKYIAYFIVFLGGIRSNWVQIGHFEDTCGQWPAANGQRPSCVRSHFETSLTTCITHNVALQNFQVFSSANVQTLNITSCSYFSGRFTHKNHLN